MNGPEVIINIREQLASEVHQAPTHSIPSSLGISPWLAMALLQKAIRRGHDGLALQAAQTLLQQRPEWFWRRCGVIAFEDVGVADLDTVALVTAALGGKRFRKKIGGEWTVASFVVDRLVTANKCRAADDLLMVAEMHPAYEKSRQELFHAALPNLLALLDSAEPLPVRALAAWHAIGTNRCPLPGIPSRKGHPQSLFDELSETGFPHTLVEIAREGFRKTNQILCPLLVLLAPLITTDKSNWVEDDPFPPETECKSVPSWALDVYTREGQTALRRFLKTNCNTAEWIRGTVPPQQQVKFLGNILFVVEGGLLRRRYRWSVADQLRRQFEIECHSPYCINASELIDQLRTDLPLLNEVRRHV